MGDEPAGEIMGTWSITHWLVVLGVALLLFGGGGKISGMMGDFAKGLKSFKKNMAEEPDASMEASAADRSAGTIAAPGTTTTIRETTATRHS